MSPFGSATSRLVVATALLLAALGLAAIAAGEGTAPGDVAIARAMQLPISPEIDAAARAISLVGDDFPAMVLFALIGVVFLVYRGRPDLALFLGVSAAFRAIGPGLKTFIGSPRPTVDSVMIVVEADGMGFPSGHAMGAALFYGAIAVIAPQATGSRLLARGIQLFAVVMMILIALSRVRLGVHWPSDVAGGLLIGLAAVCVLQALLLGWKRVRLRT